MYSSRGTRSAGRYLLIPIRVPPIPPAIANITSELGWRNKMRNVAQFFCVLLCLPVFAFSQAATGTITGTVSDQSGAVIPGVTVDVKNIETGVTFTTLSTETGNYSAPSLAPGSYSVT